jgi:hypothetical protein
MCTTGNSTQCHIRRAVPLSKIVRGYREYRFSKIYCEDRVSGSLNSVRSFRFLRGLVLRFQNSVSDSGNDSWPELFPPLGGPDVIRPAAKRSIPRRTRRYNVRPILQVQANTSASLRNSAFAAWSRGVKTDPEQQCGCFYLLERNKALCHTRFASLAIEAFSGKDSILLISQEQRGFSLWCETSREPLSHDRTEPSRRLR